MILSTYELDFAWLTVSSSISISLESVNRGSLAQRDLREKPRQLLAAEVITFWRVSTIALRASALPHVVADGGPDEAAREVVGQRRGDQARSGHGGDRRDDDEDDDEVGRARGGVCALHCAVCARSQQNEEIRRVIAVHREYRKYGGALKKKHFNSNNQRLLINIT
jgi:hypothetical protein